MKSNVGSYDGAVRFVLGCLLLIAANHGLGRWGLIGLVPILTVVTGFCPLYLLLGIRTTACDQEVEGATRGPRVVARMSERFGH